MLIKARAVFCWAGNNQRGARFVNQNGVHFIDDREIEFALVFFVETERHVVAQIIKTKFVIGAVSDVSGVGSAFLARVLERRNNAHRQPQKFIQRTHPRGIAAGKVVVYRHHMHAFTRQRIQVNRQRTDQRFTFAGTHFSNFAAVQNHATNELHVEVTHSHHALTRLTRHGEGFGKQII